MKIYWKYFPFNLKQKDDQFIFFVDDTTLLGQSSTLNNKGQNLLIFAEDILDVLWNSLKDKLVGPEMWKTLVSLAVSLELSSFLSFIYLFVKFATYLV